MRRARSHMILIFCLAAAVNLSFTKGWAQFSIGPGGFVTVRSGGSLMIGTDLHIRSDATGSGYLADQNINGNIVITGDIAVDRYMTADVWHNAASPVSDEDISCYPGTDLVFWYDESLILNDWNFGWVWYRSGNLTVFRGYDVYFETNPVTVNYYASGTGNDTLNTGPYTIGVINTTSTPSEIASHKGWNLLGNPYPSPVDWLAAAGWDKSDINDAKYIWDGSNDIYTIFIGGSAPYGVNGGTRFIPSNQGFWVQSVVLSGTVSIDNRVRIGDITGTPDFYKLQPADYPVVSLFAKGNGRKDEAVVRFISGTTGGFDRDYDAMKLFSYIGTVPQLSIHSGSQDFALNTLPGIPDNLEIVLDFRCQEEGLYSLELSDRTSLPSGTKLYLKDVKENIVLNLLENRSWSFYHDIPSSRDRFRLYFNPSDDIIDNISPESYFSVFNAHQSVIIMKNTSRNISGDVIIYTMMGQPYGHYRLENEEKLVLNINLPTGYYIVSIRSEEQVLNYKILVVR